MTVGLGWITTLFALAGAVVIAAVMGSALFLVLGACAALGSVVVFVVRAMLTRRRRRDERRARDVALAAYEQEIEQQRRAFAAHLRSTVHPLDRLVEVRDGDELWQRRSHHDDAFSVSLGWGSLEWAPMLATDDAVSTLLDRIQTIDDVLVTTTLSPGRAVAVTGDGAGIVRSLVVQLAVTMGPADWSLVVVADDPSAWNWCRWLPHLHGGRRGAVVAADDQESIGALFDRLVADDAQLSMVLVVTDRPDLLAMRTGAMRRLLTSERPSALCVLAERSDDVPSLCTGIVHVRQRCRGRWTPDATTAPPHRLVHLAGMGRATAERVARRLAALVDPEVATAAGDVPPEVGLTALLLDRSQGRITSSAVGRWWVDHDTPRSLSTVLGVGDGLVEVDLVTDGPHALIGGTTGSGKSELLRTLVVGLAARYEPARLNFVLVDYKGGSTFDACALLPHTVGMVTDLDDQLAERALQSLRAELRWREAELRARGVADLVDDPCRHGDGDGDRQPIARLVVVIDEFAALAAELPGFLTSLVAIAQRGRSLGVHLVLATQRPAGVVSDDIRANTNLRIALRLHDTADARDIVDDDAPARFARTQPGRAMLRLGASERIEFQVASCTTAVRPPDPARVIVESGTDAASSAASELDALVSAVREAHDRATSPSLRRAWLEPLPPVLAAEGFDGDLVEPGGVGLFDVPDEQARRSVCWSPQEDTNLALVGARGSGTTATMATLLAELGRRHDPRALHVYVIDTTGEARLDAVANMAHCGAVVRVGERERLGRLVDRLVGELDRRRASTAHDRQPRIVWCVDGFAALRDLDDSFLAGSIDERLLRLLAEGPAVGITAIIAVQPGRGASTAISSCARRWLFHLDDRSDAVLVGARPGDVPAAIPGRMLDVGSGLYGQIVSANADNLALVVPLPGGPAPVETLPASISLDELAAGPEVAGSCARLRIGRQFHDLGPATLVVRGGEHVLVAGSARSGRSATLRTIAEAWARCHPSGEVIVVDGRASGAIDAAVLSGLAASGGDARPRLLVVDDADRVADADGALAALVERAATTLTVVAAVRPSSVRADYGHWTRLVRRSRLGIVLTAGGEADGDVLGETLPRCTPVPPRPGLGYIVQDGVAQLTQIALPSGERGCAPAPPASRTTTG
ncbi:MAG: FtsK/SpoIIIE domain-containing protein [Ilumatobacteraceae bacterium]